LESFDFFQFSALSVKAQLRKAATKSTQRKEGDNLRAETIKKRLSE
jgi:hypothetical protein